MRDTNINPITFMNPYIFFEAVQKNDMTTVYDIWSNSGDSLKHMLINQLYNGQTALYYAVDFIGACEGSSVNIDMLNLLMDIPKTTDKEFILFDGSNVGIEENNGKRLFDIKAKYNSTSGLINVYGPTMGNDSQGCWTCFQINYNIDSKGNIVDFCKKPSEGIVLPESALCIIS